MLFRQFPTCEKFQFAGQHMYKSTNFDASIAVSSTLASDINANTNESINRNNKSNNSNNFIISPMSSSNPLSQTSRETRDTKYHKSILSPYRFDHSHGNKHNINRYTNHISNNNNNNNNNKSPYVYPMYRLTSKKKNVHTTTSAVPTVTIATIEPTAANGCCSLPLSSARNTTSTKLSTILSSSMPTNSHANTLPQVLSHKRSKDQYIQPSNVSLEYNHLSNNIHLGTTTSINNNNDNNGNDNNSTNDTYNIISKSSSDNDDTKISRPSNRKMASRIMNCMAHCQQ